MPLKIRNTLTRNGEKILLPALKKIKHTKYSNDHLDRSRIYTMEITLSL